MIRTQPDGRIQFAEREVERYRNDIEGWKENLDDLAQDCRDFEDVVAKANFVYGRLLDLDMRLQEFAFKAEGEVDLNGIGKLQVIFREWLEVSQEFLPHVLRLEEKYGSVEGGTEFRANVKEARASLTPDDRFFNGDKLAELRDAAIDDFRAGLTEPLLDDEPIA